MLQAKDVERTESGIYLPKAGILVSGKYQGEIYRDGKIIQTFEEPNLVTDEGLNSLLDVYFHASAQITTWYLGVFEGAAYTPVAGTTGATVATASTETTAYTASTRPEYLEDAAASKSTSNSSNRASFIFNATKNIYGAFLISNNTKNGNTGTLFSISKFASPKSVEANDELLLTYTFTAASV